MLSKCANPDCSTPFQYLRDGKLFRIEIDTAAFLVNGRKPSGRIEHFWLCGPCSSRLTLTYKRGQGVVTLPIEVPAPLRRAAAS